MKVIRHRDFIHCYGARNPGRQEQFLRDAADAKPPVTPGHFIKTLGYSVPIADKRNRATGMSKAKLKSRITLPKVW